MDDINNLITFDYGGLIKQYSFDEFNKNGFNVSKLVYGVISKESTVWLGLTKHGDWSLPGGHQEKESSIETVIRETSEEIDITVNVDKFLGNFGFNSRIDERIFLMEVYLLNFTNGELKMRQDIFSEGGYFSREGIGKLFLAPAISAIMDNYFLQSK